MLIKEIRFIYIEEFGQIKCTRKIITDSGTVANQLCIDRQLFGLSADEMAYEIADRFSEAARELVSILKAKK